MSDLGFTMEPYEGSKKSWDQAKDGSMVETIRIANGWVVKYPDGQLRWASPSEVMLWAILQKLEISK